MHIGKMRPPNPLPVEFLAAQSADKLDLLVNLFHVFAEKIRPGEDLIASLTFESFFLVNKFYVKFEGRSVLIHFFTQLARKLTWKTRREQCG